MNEQDEKYKQGVARRARAALNGRLETQRARVNRLKAMMYQLEIDLEFESAELARLERCQLVDEIDDAFFGG